MSWCGRVFLPQGRNEKPPRPSPTRSKLSIFRQLCNLIPTHLVSKLARDTGVEDKSRSFTPWSHVVSLLFAQFTHAFGLNDEIVLFDKAYMDFVHLQDLNARGVFWVARAKDNLRFKVVQKRIKKPEGKILRDDEILLTVGKSRADYPQRMRRVVALVEVDGVEREMVFLTNNLEWAADTVAELYRCRWQIEVFFKQIKQTLQLADFPGNSANPESVRGWQVWTALLVYVLLQYQAFLSQWGSSFVRLWTCVRAALWLKLEAVALFKSYGTAGGDFRLLGQPEAAYLPGFRPDAVG